MLFPSDMAESPDQSNFTFKLSSNKVFNNSTTIENNDLHDKNKALILSIKEKNQEIKNYNRTYYICRFIIGFLAILSIYQFIQSLLA